MTNNDPELDFERKLGMTFWNMNSEQLFFERELGKNWERITCL